MDDDFHAAVPRKLGIVCPMANESATAVAFVKDVLTQCDHVGFESVMFFAVIDKVSKDNTLELMHALANESSRLQVIWAPENRCVVDAYVRGYQEALQAGCDWILEIDAGYSHQPSDIRKFFEKMAEGYTCVFGSRFCPGGTVRESSIKRRLVSRGGTVLTNLLLGTRLTDMTSGFQLFSKAALEAVLSIGIHSRGPFFQTEIKTYCRHLHVAEIPIVYRSPSHNINSRALRDAFGNLWRLFRLRLAGGLP